MIPKAERDADAAILAALPKYIEIDEDGSVWDCSGHGAHVARVGDATDADIRKAAAHAVNRLPVYIEAAAEMERRIAEVEADIARRDATDRYDDQRGYTNGMRRALAELFDR